MGDLRSGWVARSGDRATTGAAILSDPDKNVKERQDVPGSFFSRVGWLLSWMLSDDKPNVVGSVELAKWVLVADEEVEFGIFGQIGYSGFFPPREFLNEFLMSGHDPCDQDGRMPAWTPFVVSPEEYAALKAWWTTLHAGAVEDDLGAACWGDWVQEILNR